MDYGLIGIQVGCHQGYRFCVLYCLHVLTACHYWYVVFPHYLAFSAAAMPDYLPFACRDASVHHLTNFCTKSFTVYSARLGLIGPGKHACCPSHPCFAEFLALGEVFAPAQCRANPADTSAPLHNQLLGHCSLHKQHGSWSSHVYNPSPSPKERSAFCIICIAQQIVA